MSVPDPEPVTGDETVRMLAAQLIDPRSLPVRFSRLKLMALSPAHYFAACQRVLLANDIAEETLAQRVGSGVHAIVLGQPVKRYSARRAGKDWDAFAEANKDATILNDREWHEAQAMASSLLRHREACALLFDETAREVELRWKYLGRECSSRPDARGAYHLAELKTARTSKPGLFARDAIRMHYHGQVSFYDEAHYSLTGQRFANVYIIAIEKTDPYPVTVYRLTERALEAGRKQSRLWMEMLLVCEAAHEWPAYAESIVDLDTPDEDHGPIEIEIDGRLTEVG